MAKYISGKFKNLQVGIKGYSEDKLALNIVGIVSAASYQGGGISTTGTSLFNNLNVSGVSTFADKVIIGGGTTDLLVNGDARITGILTIGTSSLTLDGSNNKINVGSAGTIDSTGYKIGDSFVHSTGANIKQLIVSGVSTFAENINANGDIVGDTATNISGINSVTATNLFGALTGNVQGNLTGTVETGAQPNITSLGTLTSLDVTGNVSVGGTLTYEDVTNIDSVGLITARSGLRINDGGLVVTGVSTFAGITTVTGDTLFAKNTNFSGITTINYIHILQQLNHITVGPGVSTFTGDLHVYGNLYPQGNVVGDNSTNISGVYDVQILNELNVLGNIVCNNSNITGINSATATSFYGDGSNLAGVALSTILSDAGINTAGSSNFDNLYVSGISTFQDDIFIGVGATVGIGSTVFFGSDVEAKFGDNGELKIFHDTSLGGTNYVRLKSTDTILIGAYGTTKNVNLYGGGGNNLQSDNNRLITAGGTEIIETDTTTAYLKHSGNEKLRTTLDGVQIGTVGISTLGIVTAVSGIVTYYGDAKYLSNGTWDEIDPASSAGRYNFRAGEFAAPTLGNQGNYSARNIAIGHSAFGQNHSSAYDNVIIGHESGYFTTSDKNTFVGYRAGKNSGQGGGNNTIIGADLDLPLIGGSNQFVIGCGSINIVGVLDKIGIGTTNPQEKLHVVGVVSATSFYGDGSALTGVISGVGIQTASGNVGFGITYLKFIGDGIGEITAPVTGISTINITGAATTTGNIIVPFAYAHIKVEAAGVGIGMTYGAYNSSNGRQEFYFNSAQPNSDYYILSEREQYDTHSVSITNKTTSGFRATWLDNSGSGALSPSTFPGVLIAYGSDPKTAASVFDTGISTVGTQQFTNLDLSGYLNVTGVSTFTGDVSVGSSILIGDSKKLLFGAGPDGAIHSDGSNFIIRGEPAGGTTYLNGKAVSIGAYGGGSSNYTTIYVQQDPGGNQRVDLNYNGSERLGTTNEGVKVTGVTSTTDLYVTGVTTAGIITGATYYGDGSNLTGVSGSGGVSIKDGGSAVGTASTIDFGTNLSVSALSSGIVTVTASGGGGGASGLWESNSTGINTSTNVGIGTTTASDATLTVDVGTAVTAFNVVGSEGSLFSVTNNLSTGSIFSVNDISGIPSFDVDADGTIQIAPFGVNEKVGIGTTNPQEKLHVVGVVSATSFYGDGSKLTGITGGHWAKTDVGINTSSNVGIGTTNPSWEVHVHKASGTAQISAKNVGGNASFYAEASSGNTAKMVLTQAGTSSYDLRTGSADALQIYRDSSELLRITSGGNVGIGTDDPKFKTHIVGSGSTTLMVEGNARITGILTIGQSSITLDPSSRKLTGLDEVELGQGVNKVILKKTAKGYMEFVDSNNRDARVAIGTDSDINTVGVITATRFVGDGSGITGVTATGSGIGIKDSGSVVGTATTVDFGTNLNVTAVSSGIVTVSSSSFTTGKAIAMSMIFG